MISFVINWDSSVGSAPADFVTGFETAVNYLLGTLPGTHPVTITLNVGWGEAGGQTLSPFALGQSLTYLNQVDYKSALQPAMSAYLPAADPVSGTHTYWIPTAEQEALGIPGNYGSLDGAVGFSNRVNWNFTSATTGSGQYDFVSVAEHEITETMGRIALLGGTVGGTANSYTPYDLFRFSDIDTRSLTPGSTAYFSYNGGKSSDPTNGSKTYFNSTAGGDYGDWASSAGNDAYNAFASSGVSYSVSHGDRLVMDVLGYGTPT